MGIIESLFWLSLNIYHEARGEEYMGKLAVAHVTLNSSKQKNKSIKQIVQEPFQFSWTIENEYLPDPKDVLLFIECMGVGIHAANGFDFTMGATHYHATRIDPYWTSSMSDVGQYGNHIFYVKK